MYFGENGIHHGRFSSLFPSPNNDFSIFNRNNAQKKTLGLHLCVGFFMRGYLQK